MKKKSPTPYADRLVELAGMKDTRLMIPGHQNTTDNRLSDFVGNKAVSIDLPTLLEGLDKGEGNPYDESLKLAAEAFKARKVWFLNNGASQGNRMIGTVLGSFSRGGRVLAQRSAHSSFIDGMIMGDVNCLFISPSVDYKHGINHGLTVQQVQDALRVNNDITAVYLISPSYFGAVSDIRGISDVAHSYGVPLIVDASWGSHFGFSPKVPENPIVHGADIVVASMHKLGGSLTQSAMLHLRESEFADRLEPLIDRSLNLTQSTSTSTLLLGSLDIARAELVDGEEDITFAAHLGDAFRDKIRKTGVLKVVSDDFQNFPDIVDADPLHVSVDVTGLGITGSDAHKRLREEFGIYAEISTATSVVFLIGFYHDFNVNYVVKSLLKLQSDKATHLETLKLPPISESKMSVRRAYFSEAEVVDYKNAVGRISADSLSAYPPGIPNVIPGEVLTQEIIDFLRYTARLKGGWVRGAVDAKVSSFSVVKQ